eukprot:gene10937-biopygen11201
MWLEALADAIKGYVMRQQALADAIKDQNLRLLKVKLGKHRRLQKRKRRICVRGNKQEYGVDYVDTFAPCTQLSSVRIVIVLALNLGLVVYHMDVDTAFLNYVLEKDLYVRLPRGLEYGGCRCAKLLKAVYGLKQAGKEWFNTSDAFIMGYDSRMQRRDVEPCLYFIKDTELMVVILAYVDDYLVARNDKSWPDIMAAVSVPSRFCATCGPEHSVDLKQVVRYLKETKDHELVLRAASAPGGVWYWTEHTTTTLHVHRCGLCWVHDDRKEHLRDCCVFLCGSLVIFSSMIQKCVSLSTTEAEIIAVSEGAREVKYILNVLDSLVNIHKPVPMFCDNQGAIHLASDYVNNSRLKHIEVRNMHIRELIKAKETEALYTGTADNTSDIMTKPLALPILRVHRERLGGVMSLHRE